MLTLTFSDGFYQENLVVYDILLDSKRVIYRFHSSEQLINKQTNMRGRYYPPDIIPMTVTFDIPQLYMFCMWNLLRFIIYN